MIATIKNGWHILEHRFHVSLPFIIKAKSQGTFEIHILQASWLRSVSAEYTESTVHNLLVLGLQAFEIASAIVLYEGVRRDVVCMIKLWFLYCVARFVVLTSTIYPNLVSSSRSKLRIWIYGFEVAFTTFHIVQCICLLTLRHQSKSPALHDDNISKRAVSPTFSFGAGESVSEVPLDNVSEVVAAECKGKLGTISEITV
ncbi:hypothetical protein Fcan01_13095 [Folsomia candida]|uniref:Uncharacterized protein n=1 Tax=Folsomia candida TaxID=158441 RepID=A0A226E3A5_FOLCA|nr:hypothetical protein Fcan01_13095 [Folsomia candida]